MEWKYDNGQAVSVDIEGKEYLPEDDGVFYFPLATVGQFTTKEIPPTVRLNLFEVDPKEPSVRRINMEGELQTDNDSIFFHFNELRRGKFWREDYALTAYHKAIERAIQTIHIPDTKYIFAEIEDSGDDYLWLKFSIQTKFVGTIAASMNRLEELRKFLEAEAMRIVRGISFDKETLLDEKKFTLNVVMPILRAMGMYEVQYAHGTREFGKDVTFTEESKWGTRRYYGVQVKAGNVSGGSDGDIDTIVAQLDDGFELPYIAVSSAEERKVHEMIVAVSGYFTENAKEKILNKAFSKLRGRRNILFLSIDEWRSLADRYLRLPDDSQSVSSGILKSILQALNRIEETQSIGDCGIG